MTQLAILRYPDPRLHTVAKPVAVVDARIKQLTKDMFETMYAAEGLGLAATQVDVHERVVVMDIADEGHKPMVLINPEVLWRSDEVCLGKEGCLSVPGIYDEVERAKEIKVQALDENGQMQVIEASGLLAVCIQHEMDHLMGRVFVEYLSSLKRGRIVTKLNKELRDQVKNRQ